MTRLRCYLDFADAEIKKQFPLSKSETTNMLGSCLKELIEEEEYKESLLLVGASPHVVGIRICDDEEMRSLYERYKGTRRTTDVLSFATRDDPVGAEPGYLGDILLSLETVERHRKRYRKTLRNELSEVLIHSLLHLLGFEHVGVSAQKAKRMKSIQRKLSRAYALK